MQRQVAKTSILTAQEYARFKEIDGTHDFKELVPHGYVEYPVRKLKSGKVMYFNFDLAKEMNLIEQNHPEIMNEKLEASILDTFCVQIVNEYDQQKKFPRSWELKPNKYMATRYLQLQHKSKSGKTSGDGRSVWLGQIKNDNTIWDISARGTGVTCFSPAYGETDKPLRSGDTTYGYGCGTVDLDELIGTCLQSEIFHRQGINTERTLAIIKTGAKIGIGVRAGVNLFRPAHLFLPLKQRNIKQLSQIFKYVHQRVTQNHSRQRPSLTNLNRFYIWLTKELAAFAAVLDRNYIFLWMEWDGDNLLLEPGIIDYGSIRQFGSYHNEYRYDDATSWSTNLSEQKDKARHICKTYIQMMRSLKLGKLVPLTEVASHPLLDIFDREFERHQLRIFFYFLGFENDHFRKLKSPLLNKLKSIFSQFHKLEKRKAGTRFYPTGDGINKPALYDMRKFLHHYPKVIQAVNSGAQPLKDILSEFTIERRHVSKLRSDLTTWHGLLQDLTSLVASMSLEFQIKPRALTTKAQKRNPLDRMTGNAIILTVEKLMRTKDSTVFLDLVNGIIKAQGELAPPAVFHSESSKREFEKINDLIHQFRTDI